jgi:hypothetical protein
MRWELTREAEPIKFGHTDPLTAEPRFVRESRSLREKVIALREAASLAGGRPVVRHGSLAVSSEFQQMCLNSGQTVMIRNAGVCSERVQQL